MRCKGKLETLHSIITMSAIIVGGWWTYENFLKERRNLPHANVEHIISHLPLTTDIQLLSVVVKVTNSGYSRMKVVKSDVRIQQVLPIDTCAETKFPCANDQISAAVNEVARSEDRYAWPKIAARQNYFNTALDIEPGESEHMDFEFAIPAHVTAIRVFSYIRNETKVLGNDEFGWRMSSFYRLSS